MSDFLFLFILLALILNLYVSYRVIKNVGFSSVQKKLQLALIWGIPYMSSIGIWLFIKSEEIEEKKVESFAKKSRPENTINVDGFE